VGQASARIQKRRQAKNIIAKLMDQSDQVIVIHYSCESFYNRVDGPSPRITSIAVRHLDSGQTRSFSIHQMAERKGHDMAGLEEYYALLERLMLDEFFEFVKTHSNYKWLHWNMRDSKYGFQAIAHRYRTLKGKPIEFDNSKLFDLPRFIHNLYGPNYIGHPRLASIVKKNQITDLDFLDGKEEAQAFEERQYVKLHHSTLRKVDVIATIIEHVENGTLKTNSSWKDSYGNYPQAIVEIFQEKWWIVAIIALIGIISDVLGLFNLWP